MVDIADMMLDGTLCEGCGVYVGEAVGHPVKCEHCEPPKAEMRDTYGERPAKYKKQLQRRF